MFEWKNVELSPEDYENYIWNEDEGQARVNCLNITELQWSQLYHKAQQKSIQNKKIKKNVLAYESILKRLFVEGCEHIPAKELQRLYEKQNNELKIHLSQLYDQIGLLHIRNISTVVEFTISRLLNLEQDLIKIICSQQVKIDQLKQQKQRLELNKNSRLCISCLQEMQKNRNKLLFHQVMTCDKPASLLEELEMQELTEPEKLQKQNREASKKQENQYEIQRLCYLNSVEQVLKNRQKILKCNSAPLQNLLSEYLTQILQMLQGSKLPFTQKNIKEYDRINKSYESIEDMKSLINSQNFYKKVSILLQKPYQNLVDNIQRYVKSTQSKINVKKFTVQTQTIFLAQFDHIKNLQKRTNELNFELQSLKQSKSKNEFDLINNLQSLHRIQIKYMEAVNRNKSIEAENKRLQIEINELKIQLKNTKQDHRSDQDKLIDMNQIEKSRYIKEIKLLEEKIKDFQIFKTQKTIKIQKTEKEIQTESNYMNDNMITFSEQYENIFKTNQKLMTERKSQKRNRKRTTLRLQDTKIFKQLPQLSHFQHKRVESNQINIPSSKQNIVFLDVNDAQRPEIRAKTIKILTLTPMEQLNDTLIHRVSSRKLEPARIKEAEAKIKCQTSSMKSPALSPVKQKKNIKRITQNKLKHNYHASELSNKAKQHQRDVDNATNRRKNHRQNSIDINCESKQVTQFEQYLHCHQQINNSHTKITKDKLSSEQNQYVLKINNVPTQIKNQQEEILLTNIMSKQQSLNYQQQKEQLSKLMRFSIKNYDILIQKNIFGLLYDMKFEKSNKNNTKKDERRANNSKIEPQQQTDNVVDVECAKIGKKCLEIFFNMQQAQKYEKKIGIWQQFDAFIMIDNNFSKYCEKIQQFFQKLKKDKPMLYQQSILFLQKPFYFCQQVEGKDYETRQITIFRQSLKIFHLQKNWIKKLFEKLLKLHRLIHKNCNHIQNFLNIIGYK